MEAAGFGLVYRVILLVRVEEGALCGGNAKGACNPVASKQPAAETYRNPARYPMSDGAVYAMHSSRANAAS
jgi:hypothetical protein